MPKTKYILVEVPDDIPITNIRYWFGGGDAFCGTYETPMIAKEAVKVNKQDWTANTPDGHSVNGQPVDLYAVKTGEEGR